MACRSRGTPYPRRDVVLSDCVAFIGVQEGWCSSFMPALYRRWFIDRRDVAAEAEIGSVLNNIGQKPERVLTLARTEASIRELAREQRRQRDLAYSVLRLSLSGPKCFGETIVWMRRAGAGTSGCVGRWPAFLRRAASRSL